LPRPRVVVADNSEKGRRRSRRRRRWRFVAPRPVAILSHPVNIVLTQLKAPTGVKTLNSRSPFPVLPVFKKQDFLNEFFKHVGTPLVSLSTPSKVGPNPTTLR
jgi:hypothetical protein